MHLPGAKTSTIVHPAICSCVFQYIINISKIWEKDAHTGCTAQVEKSMQPQSKCAHQVQGAPIISNTECILLTNG